MMGINSVGQSGSLINCWSWVRVPDTLQLTENRGEGSCRLAWGARVGCSRRAADLKHTSPSGASRRTDKKFGVGQFYIWV